MQNVRVEAIPSPRRTNPFARMEAHPYVLQTDTGPIPGIVIRTRSRIITHLAWGDARRVAAEILKYADKFDPEGAATK